MPLRSTSREKNINGVFRIFQPLHLLGITLVLRPVEAVRTPIVEWGQKPDRLFIRLPLKDVAEPEFNLEDQRIYFKGFSNGEEYEVDLHLIRGINVTAKKVDFTPSQVTFEFPKLRSEPCWKRLLKTKQQSSWLRKDKRHHYYNDCHDKMVQWREAYFYAKLHPEWSPPPLPKSSNNAKVDGKKNEESGAAARLSKERQMEEDTYVAEIETFRAKAVPRQKKEKKAKNKKKNEL
eukprot:TRINITY_DN59001_c0_g1_i1.p1 TRINITY_DN59001_c0_g1~~TRINITY_DN59001_c0_g1_i1.p1  ORF type:complete len:234 (-),score=42.00 TRINITY_DN59001_c0_g1_i1:95-796(-)